ncbi:MAG: histidine phosphatase family protein [Dehalococcoidia bacterium]|nr:histidine phosphatase family protein [Dehalococcoidia bacterium]
MAATIILVRHGLPAIDRAVPSEAWQLDPAGLGDISRMVEALPVPLERQVFHSPLPKAAATASVFSVVRGLQLVADERLREADHDGGWIDDYAAVARAYVSGEPLAGWEPQADVVRRMSEAIDEATGTREGTVAFVTHGLAMSLFLASRTHFDAAEFWAGLSLPDAWRLDRTGELTRLVRTASPGG